MAAGVKRKRIEGTRDATQEEATNTAEELPEHPLERVQRLEALISESNKHLNHIRTLLSLAKNNDDEEVAISASIASCRIFCRLVTRGTFNLASCDPINSVLDGWLEERYGEYTELLLHQLESKKNAIQRVAITLLMRLVKIEAKQNKARLLSRKGIWTRLIRCLVMNEKADAARFIFIAEYMKAYKDIKLYFCRIFIHEIPELCKGYQGDRLASQSLKLLQEIEFEQHDDEELDVSFFGKSVVKTSLAALKKAVQAAWLELLKLSLCKDDLRTVLTILPHRIAPWFVKTELLMDFLTDAYNAGGGISLLALSGLFYLIRERNLDYPAFYNKLYSLLDSNLLHSKYRSQFFRQLEIFMSSTHLPATLVASFIKKLSRLALLAPPAGIVAVIPWVYNMIVTHRVCAFMIHREIRDPDVLRNIEENGASDPFDEEELDPMHSQALDSSLWEIYSLQTHYHPQVAALAKIISEQFTKRSYNLEDFLNHSYEEIIGSELNKVLRKAPVIEENVSENVFVDAAGDATRLGSLAMIAMKIAA